MCLSFCWCISTLDILCVSIRQKGQGCIVTLRYSCQFIHYLANIYNIKTFCFEKRLGELFHQQYLMEMIQDQIIRFVGPKGRKKLSRLRSSAWYHDSLLHYQGLMDASIFRKLRLGVSDLFEQTHFLNAYVLQFGRNRIM